MIYYNKNNKKIRCLYFQKLSSIDEDELYNEKETKEEYRNIFKIKTNKIIILYCVIYVIVVIYSKKNVNKSTSI